MKAGHPAKETMGYSDHIPIFIQAQALNQAGIKTPGDNINSSSINILSHNMLGRMRDKGDGNSYSNHPWKEGYAEDEAQYAARFQKQEQFYNNSGAEYLVLQEVPKGVKQIGDYTRLSDADGAKCGVAIFAHKNSLVHLPLDRGGYDAITLDGDQDNRYQRMKEKIKAEKARIEKEVRVSNPIENEPVDPQYVTWIQNKPKILKDHEALRPAKDSEDWDKWVITNNSLQEDEAVKKWIKQNPTPSQQWKDWSKKKERQDSLVSAAIEKREPDFKAWKDTSRFAMMIKKNKDGSETMIVGIHTPGIHESSSDEQKRAQHDIEKYFATVKAAHLGKNPNNSFIMMGDLNGPQLQDKKADNHRVSKIENTNFIRNPDGTLGVATRDIIAVNNMQLKIRFSEPSIDINGDVVFENKQVEADQAKGASRPTESGQITLRQDEVMVFPSIPERAGVAPMDPNPLEHGGPRANLGNLGGGDGPPSRLADLPVPEEAPVVRRRVTPQGPRRTAVEIKEIQGKIEEYIQAKHLTPITDIPDHLPPVTKAVVELATEIFKENEIMCIPTLNDKNEPCMCVESGQFLNAVIAAYEGRITLTPETKQEFIKQVNNEPEANPDVADIALKFTQELAAEATIYSGR